MNLRLMGGYGGLDLNSTRDGFESHLCMDTKSTPHNPPYDVKTETRNPPGKVI